METRRADDPTRPMSLAWEQTETALAQGPDLGLGLGLQQWRPSSPALAIHKYLSAVTG